MNPCFLGLYTILNPNQPITKITLNLRQNTSIQEYLFKEINNLC